MPPLWFVIRVIARAFIKTRITGILCSSLSLNGSIIDAMKNYNHCYAQVLCSGKAADFFAYYKGF